LQAGIEKLESWQATAWGYYDQFAGFLSGETAEERMSTVKDELAQKLRRYKRAVTKVNAMITDSLRTRFVVVCIAEHLSEVDTIIVTIATVC
jgi:anion-transporting  ArsA/GET3 family ATPase